MSTFPKASALPFWGLPYFFPIHQIVSKSFLFPEVAPFDPPYAVRAKLIERRTIDDSKEQIEISVDTWDHMSIMVMPRPGWVLANWTAGDGSPGVTHVIKASEGHKERVGYFMFYGYGRKPRQELRLQFDILLLESSLRG